MTPAGKIVDRALAQKIPNGERWLFERHELVALVQAVQEEVGKCDQCGRGIGGICWRCA